MNEKIRNIVKHLKIGEKVDIELPEVSNSNCVAPAGAVVLRNNHTYDVNYYGELMPGQIAHTDHGWQGYDVNFNSI